MVVVGWGLCDTAQGRDSKSRATCNELEWRWFLRGGNPEEAWAMEARAL